VNNSNLLGFIAILIFVTSLCSAQSEEGPTEFAPLWIEKSAVAEPGAVQATLDRLAEQEPDPEQILVFIHGFKKPRQGSTRDFNLLSKRVEAKLDRSKTRVGLVGVQWDSSTSITKVKGLDALRMIRAYRDSVSLARSVGRGPTRELLLALQEKYPKAHLSVFAHSMGCEVATAALLPEIAYEDYPPFIEPFRPDQDVQLDMLVLAGSDLDYDFWYKSGISARELEERTRLTWLTVSDYLTKGDKVLNTRKRIRGRAGGANFPRMTLEQLDQSVAERRIFLDRRGIPRGHQFLDYYEEPRLERILDTLRYLTEARAPQPDEIAELDEILAAPDQLESLLPYLDRPGYSSKFYALWRLERVNCGDARHMTDLTLDELTELLRSDPEKISEVRQKCECLTVQKAQFPTEKALMEARKK
jgi:alpha/beta hydrolase family protein DUF900